MGWKQLIHQFSCFSTPSSHLPNQCTVYHYLKSQRFCVIIILKRSLSTVWEWPWLHQSESSTSQAISKGTQSLISRAETSPPSVTGPAAEPALWGRNWTLQHFFSWRPNPPWLLPCCWNHGMWGESVQRDTWQWLIQETKTAKRGMHNFQSKTFYLSLAQMHSEPLTFPCLIQFAIDLALRDTSAL